MPLTKITRGALTADIIDSTKLEDNAVDTEHLADDAVGSAELAPNLTFTGDYVDIPSCTTTERDALSAQVGMLVYNSTMGMLQQNNSSGWASIASPPVYGSVNVSNLEESDTTQTLVITGSNFDSGASAKLIDNNGTTKNPTTSTRNSSTQITIAYTGGDLLAETVAQPLDIVVTNASGLGTTAENAITIDAKPVWVSPAIGELTDQTYREDIAISTLNFVATDVETTPTYTISSGALPSGLSLSSAGALTGTPNVNDTYNANGVTHNFDVRADDGTGNTVDRSFSIVRYWKDGGSAGRANTSCQAIQDLTGTTSNGVRYLNPGGSTSQFYCDMSTHSGYGWTLVGTRSSSTILSQSGTADNTSSYGTTLTNPNVEADNVYKDDWDGFGTWTYAWQSLWEGANNFYISAINNTHRNWLGVELLYRNGGGSFLTDYLDCRKFLNSVGQPASGGTVIDNCGNHSYEGWTTDPGVGWCWWHHPSQHPGTGDCGINGYDDGKRGTAWIGGS